MKAFDGFFLLDSENRYTGLEGLRALAVILVFNVHFFAQYGARGYFTQNPILGFVIGALNSGMVGVDVFFVISGFLIWKMMFIKGKKRRPYLASRFMRLYPLYAMVVLVFLFSRQSVKLLARELLFLPTVVSAYTYANTVSWSLGWEWIFYFIILLASLVPAKARKLYLPIAATLSALLIAVPKPAAIAFPDFRFMNFFLGCLLAEYPMAFENKTSRVAGIISLPLLLAASAAWAAWHERIQANPLIQSLYFIGVGTISLFLLRDVLDESGFYKRFFSWKPLRALGQMSYSFYLTHSIIAIPIANSMWDAVDSVPSMGLSYALCMTVALGMSAFFFFVVERNYFLVKTARA